MELQNPEKKKRRKHPSRPTKPSQATRLRRLTGGPRLSAAVLPRARPPSLALSSVGLTCQRQFPSPVRSLSLCVCVCLAGPVHQCRAVAPTRPLLSLCAVGLSCQFRLPRSRHGLASAHSRMSPGFSATTPAHAPNSLFRAPPVPHAHPSPHFAHPRPLSRSALAAGDLSPRSQPSSSLEIAPSLPELRPEVRHPSRAQFPLLCPVFVQFRLRRCSTAAVCSARMVAS
jgi:hypothetical protein